MFNRKTLITAFMAIMISTSASANGLFGTVVHAIEKKVESHQSTKEASTLYNNKQKEFSFDACREQFPNKRAFEPKAFPKQMNPIALCSDNFAVLYSGTSKTPIVVVERLNAAQISDAKGEARTDKFFADPRLPENMRAELSDYTGHNVDRGHQAPAADAPNHHAMAQTFALSNMVPQDSENNRKVWSKVESYTRKYVSRAEGDVFVFTGPLYGNNVRKIGANKVWVPDRLFKLVYDVNTQKAWAYILPNAPTEISKPVDYETFVKESGLPLLKGLTVK